MTKAKTLAAVVLDTTLEEAHMEVPATRPLTVTERSPDMEGLRNRRALGSSRPESRRLASTRRSKSAGEKHYLSDSPHTGRDEAIVLLSEYEKKRDADKK
jgi:hypothetical protein